MWSPSRRPRLQSLSQGSPHPSALRASREGLRGPMQAAIPRVVARLRAGRGPDHPNRCAESGQFLGQRLAEMEGEFSAPRHSSRPDTTVERLADEATRAGYSPGPGPPSRMPGPSSRRTSTPCRSKSAPRPLSIGIGRSVSSPSGFTRAALPRVAAFGALELRPPSGHAGRGWERGGRSRSRTRIRKVDSPPACGALTGLDHPRRTSRRRRRPRTPHYNLDVLYFGQCRLHEAAEKFERAKGLIAAYPDPRVNLALVFARGCSPEKTRSEYHSRSNPSLTTSGPCRARRGSRSSPSGWMNRYARHRSVSPSAARPRIVKSRPPGNSAQGP